MSRRVRAGMVRVMKDGRVVRLISTELAVNWVKQGKAELVGGQGAYAVQLVAGASEMGAVRTEALAVRKAAQISTGPNGQESCRVMSQVEVEAIVGLHGVSQTKGMGEWMRDQRVRVGLEAEDLVERAQNKFPAFVPQGRKVAA
jgi:hypothetical protein